MPWFLLGAGVLPAEPPNLERIHPRGGQRGTALQLTLLGSGLGGETEVFSAIPGTLTPLTPPRESERRSRERPYLLELPADAPVGVYPLRVRTPNGLSNVLLFSVGAFPEIAEEEAERTFARRRRARESGKKFEPSAVNDSAETAQAIATPTTVNGTLTGPDQDHFRFTARAGEQLAIAVEARRIGSAIDPAIEVFDSAGRRLAYNNDAPGIGVDSRISVRFPADGEYRVVVHDAKYSAQSENYYRLKVGDFSFAEALYPLGWRRGESVEIELLGGNLGGPVKLRREPDASDPAAEFAAITAPGNPGALPLRLVLGNEPESLEPEGDGAAPAVLNPDSVLNGRISRPGEIDRYRLTVDSAEAWYVELQAAGLGTSKLYGIVTVRDPGGGILASTSDVGLKKKLSTSDLAEDTGADQFLTFDVPQEVNHVTVEIEDLLGRGGADFAYRLVVRNYPGDFSLTLVTNELTIPLRGSAIATVNAERRGYEGPIQLSARNLPNELMFDGGHVAAYEQPGAARLASNAIFTITPKPGAQTGLFDLEIWGEAEIGGKIVRRRARGPGFTTTVSGVNESRRRGRGFTTNVAPWLGFNLPAAAVKRQAAALDITSPRSMRIIPGGGYELKWTFHAREDDVSPPSSINASNTRNVRAGARRERLEKGQTSGGVVVRAQVGWGPGKFNTVLRAAIEVDGRDETVYAPAVTVEVVNAYEIAPVEEISRLQPGAGRRLGFRLIREPGFASPVEVKPENLPLGVACETVVVPAAGSEFELTCSVDADAAPGEYEIALSSSSTIMGGDDKLIPFTLPPFPAKLSIGEERSEEGSKAAAAH